MMALVDEFVVAAGPVVLTDAYRLHYASLVRLAAVLLDDTETCEEVVQDAFVAVFSRPRRIRDDAKVAPYLRSAVLNGARSQLRRRAVRQREATLRLVAGAPTDRDDDPTSARVVANAEHWRVLEAIRALPGRQRDAIALRYWGDLVDAEIAATLGIAPGTVKTHVRRGLDALARTLEVDTDD